MTENPVNAALAALLIGIFSAILSSCAFGSMTNTDIIKETSYCRDRGLDVLVYRQFGDGMIWDIQCTPKKMP